MKTTVKTTLASLAIVLMTSCKENNQDTNNSVSKSISEASTITDEVFTDGNTGKLWDNYLKLKKALVSSDNYAVQVAAKNLDQGITEDREEIKIIAQQIANSDDLDAQRELFAVFTEKAGTLFKDGLTSGTIYRQFCPMAFNNNGGYWYSDVAEVRNPYFGDRMLNCGSVKETISK